MLSRQLFSGSGAAGKVDKNVVASNMALPMSRCAAGRGSASQAPRVQHTSSSRRSLKCAGLLTAPASMPSPSRELDGSGFVNTLYSHDMEDDFSLAFELIQGSMVKWTKPGSSSPPTAVLVHGILGNRKNMQSFARLLAEAFPSWQILLVDLPCHGESATLTRYNTSKHSVQTAAMAVLGLLRELRLFPHVIMGHSFGGKVVMSMASQFGQKLPRPVQVWVLDSLPGDVRSGEPDGKDHPGQLIQLLRSIPTPVMNRFKVTDQLQEAGFSEGIARWVATNLRPSQAQSKLLDWVFDLEGISSMYSSYEQDSLWPVLEQPPQGLKVDFVKAERSTFRWGGPDEAEITRLGHGVHTLHNAGHWVHTDNPMGLLEILAPSFGEIDVRLRTRMPRN